MYARARTWVYVCLGAGGRSDFFNFFNVSVDVTVCGCVGVVFALMGSRWRVGIRVTTVHFIDLRSDIYYVLLCFILFVSISEAIYTTFYSVLFYLYTFTVMLNCRIVLFIVEFE